MTGGPRGEGTVAGGRSGPGTTAASLIAAAFARFDAINAEDPRSETVSGSREPKELAYARRMSERLADFEPGASEALRLAARAQHIARWRIPRSDYPAGRRGYRAWRAKLMRLHAEIAGGVLTEVGYGEETVATVARLIRKQGMRRDPDAQTLEDVVCLVFLEHYFEEFAAGHDDGKLVGILRKTWAKMSDRGRAAALGLRLGARAHRLIREAVDGNP